MELGKTLYDPSFEHDACGIGAVVNIDGKQTHKIVDNLKARRYNSFRDYS